MPEKLIPHLSRRITRLRAMFHSHPNPPIDYVLS